MDFRLVEGRLTIIAKRVKRAVAIQKLGLDCFTAACAGFAMTMELILL